MSKVAKAAAKSWSSTLRLPKSTFPARASPADLEKYLKRSTDDLYDWQSCERTEQPVFRLHDGPPYANGDLHVGHALNKILKDIINRTQLQQGKRIDYIPGWDCHGLPIEQKAFEHHGWSAGNKPDAVQVRKAAASFANDAVQKQMAGFRSWAIMGAWDHHWKTMDKTFEIRQLAVFRDMAKHGLIYRRHKPVYWSPSSRTALAEAELEYKENHLSKAALVKFQLSNSNNFGEGEPVSLLIWTTTPWTLPANQAIAINRDLDYIIVQSKEHGKLMLASSRLQAVEAMMDEKLHVPSRAVDVNRLLNTSYNALHPFDDSQRPIIHADFVSADAGTGLVHCAPGHGMEDYEALLPLVLSGSVQVLAPVDDDGMFTAEASRLDPSLLCGKEAFSEGNSVIITTLRQSGSLLAVHDYEHKYPYDWRTKKPVMVRATAQWFANLAQIKEDALKALYNVTFQPKTGQSRLQSFVESRSEWCISRQRSWGVPIPALYHKDTGDAVLTDKSIEHISQVLAERGTDAWWSDAKDDEAWVEPGLDASQYSRGTDTMDVWFDSGTSWTSIQQEQPLLTHQTGRLAGTAEFQQTADVYLEGTDQHRGWFQSSLLTSIAAQKARYPQLDAKAPFQKLLTHGFTLDGEGKKMSKSIGNVVSPNQIITGEFEPASEPVLNSLSAKKSKTPKAPRTPTKRNQAAGSLGPDALRLWVASSDWSRDVVVSETIVKTVHASLHKLRVTFKLLLGALKDVQLDTNLPPSPSRIDQIALLQLHNVCTEVRHAYNNLEFHRAVTAINKWVNGDLSAFYIEAVKDTLYCDHVDSIRRKHAQATLSCILSQLQSMLTPLTPMLVEETWEHFPEAQTEHEQPLRKIWANPPPEWQNEYLAKTYSPLVMAINTACKAAQERARVDKKMGSSLESECLVYVTGVAALSPSKSESSAVFRESLQQDLKDILVISHAEVFDSKTTSSSTPATSQDIEAWEGLSDPRLPQSWRTRISGLSSPWSYFEEFSMPDGATKGFVVVYPPVHEKCARCWQYAAVTEGNESQSEGGDSDDALCARCVSTVASSECAGLAASEIKS